MKTHCLTSLDSSMFSLLLPVSESLPWEMLLVYLEPHLFDFQTQEYCSTWQQRYLTIQALLQKENFLAQHRYYLWKSEFANQTHFVLALPVIPQISNIHLSALLLYYRNAPTTLRTRTLAPSMLKKDLGMRTEMNALNYMEFQVFQQVLGQGDLRPLEILLHMGSKLSLLIHVILWPSRKHFAISQLKLADC